MSELDANLEVFRKMEHNLKVDYDGKWILIHDRELVGTFDTFSAAAEHAVARFGRGPYLIRQVNAPEFVLPASVAYRPVPDHA